MNKAIETAYKGYRFRSRLEARWAVFFDAMGIEWEYEKEGYDLGEAGRYLPDFWLPELRLWAEIKPSKIEIPLSHDSKLKAYRLAVATSFDAVIISGAPGYETLTNNWYPFDDPAYGFDLFGGDYVDENRLTRFAWQDLFFGYGWNESLTEFLRQQMDEGKFITWDDAPRGLASSDTIFPVPVLVKLDKLYFRRKYNEVHPKYLYGKHETQVSWQLNDGGRLYLAMGCTVEIPIEIKEALIEARSTRFEHGEVPSIRKAVQP